MVSFTLSYDGALADNNVLDMYDAARGLAGFQRSLALVAHLVINGEIITQAPSLRGAQILSSTPEEGSWKVTAVIVGGLFTLTSAPKDTTAGHLVFSVYDYIVKSTLGFHVDLSKSLGAQAEDELKRKKITHEKLDSLMEKTESSIAEMHRPIIASKTASRARLDAFIGREPAAQVGPLMTPITYDYLSTTIRHEHTTTIKGIVSSFNINTFKGRLFHLRINDPSLLSLLKQLEILSPWC